MGFGFKKEEIYEICERLSRIEEKLDRLELRQPSRKPENAERVEADSDRVEVPARVPVHQAEDESKLPSFLRGNPWVRILSQRR